MELKRLPPAVATRQNRFAASPCVIIFAFLANYFIKTHHHANEAHMEHALLQAKRYSPFLARHLDNGTLQTASLLTMLENALSEADFQAFADWQALLAAGDEAEIARQLRVLRRYVVAHIIVRDVNRISDLNEVTRTITQFADFAVNIAAEYAHAYYTQMYGTPLGRYSQTPQFLSVVAMGKAGGYELNVSSDIDLIFVYPENGDTNGKRERSNQEFFTKVGQKIIALLNDNTADGQVFRVDMRLRPDGDAGALVLSETALEQYLVQHGREWERYAWCKGRVVTPYPNDIQSLVRPFVFRKYLDYNAYEAMRGLHRQIRAEVGKKGMKNNVKLGAGGIREVEFIAQIFQMIRGGQNRALQLKGTQETLSKLVELDILTSEQGDTLQTAYRFLRDVEHRLQYWDDQQTQTLPDNPEQQMLLAQSMDFADYDAFIVQLNQYREQVNALFNSILAEPENEQVSESVYADVWASAGDETHLSLLQSNGFDGEAVATRLNQLKNSTKYRQLSARAHQRFDALIPQILEAAAVCTSPTQTLFRLLDFLETISRRSSYLAFLQEYPNELQRVANLVSQSSWIAAYLQKHPILLDELLSEQLLQKTDNWQHLEAELAQNLQESDDTETKMDILRRFQHAQVFRLAVQDLAGLWGYVEELSDQLSFLADVVLRQTMQQVWQDLPKKHQNTAQIAIVGYGKLGGKELGYASDLDLVFVFDDPHPDAAEIYARFVRRITTWLSSNTGAGSLYDVDLRLRPDGESGFLVHSLAAFEKYQREKAWTWEHQSLTRARYICGDERVGQGFEAIRRQILTSERDEAQLRGEVIAMREKMFATHPPKLENVKYARGGVVDVEFIVQYLVLAKSANCPELLQNYGNIALLKMAAERGLIAADTARAARAAYRYFRKQQHQTKLRDAERAEVNETLLNHYASVKQLWQEVFGEAARDSV
ncbi:MAG: bifunctional [glutamate--ammonia ligase]-adenylyl-L-tyrosine phosphorylase/[glutamate--ammonia-ligase] adenylyltransferase [Neisseria sp.]|nr:bifunctional [glutamate--ammonia ligase]-adenylyl-L-tyrosine phosphorylase/[glutamate--ammonia-ligase] adenylyltransferase [Neisseria sp.]